MVGATDRIGRLRQTVPPLLRRTQARYISAAEYAMERLDAYRYREMVQCHQGLRIHPASERWQRRLRSHLGSRARRLVLSQ
jgi:hypothetical protein